MLCSQTKQKNLFIDHSRHTRATSLHKSASAMLQQLEENEELRIELFRITSRFQDLHRCAIESISRQKCFAESLFRELDATRQLCRVKVMQAHSSKSIMEGISRMEILLEQLYESINSVEERCISEQKEVIVEENELMGEHKGEQLIHQFIEQTRQASYDKAQDIAELQKLVDDLAEEVRVLREEKHCLTAEEQTWKQLLAPGCSASHKANVLEDRGAQKAKLQFLKEQCKLLEAENEKLVLGHRLSLFREMEYQARLESIQKFIPHEDLTKQFCRNQMENGVADCGQLKQNIKKYGQRRFDLNSFQHKMSTKNLRR